jgi:hypothetical protein
MGPRRLTVLIAVVLGMLVLVPSAEGGRGSGPVAKIACSQTATACSESGSIGLPPNSTGIQSTDTVPNGSQQAGTTLAPASFSADDLNAFDNTWVGVVAAFPKLGTIKSKVVRRVITCAVVAQASAQFIQQVNQTEQQFNEAEPDYYQLLLGLCLTMIAEAQAKLPAAHDASAAAAGCSTALVSVPVDLQRTASGYHVVVNAKTFKASGKPPLAVSCRRKGAGIQITLKPRARHTKLRSLLGPKLSIGFSNPTSHSLTIKTKYTFS